MPLKLTKEEEKLILDLRKAKEAEEDREAFTALLAAQLSDFIARAKEQQTPESP